MTNKKKMSKTERATGKTKGIKNIEKNKRFKNHLNILQQCGNDNYFLHTYRRVNTVVSDDFG